MDIFLILATVTLWIIFIILWNPFFLKYVCEFTIVITQLALLGVAITLTFMCYMEYSYSKLLQNDKVLNELVYNNLKENDFILSDIVNCEISNCNESTQTQTQNCIALIHRLKTKFPQGNVDIKNLNKVWLNLNKDV